ncbi:Tm-1-like ATP-binding domain-containing protein [Streptomyces meridianus]|uniref:Tm-1-like ATP-binding domain-containing protein n=1 Tax=Streptomyces meridianus TaxID=2938945 RepID=A0ABT0X3U6_9ACTN|nr:Tm-1-like ATP-binding domain-containing protein [Streptomyces meridianus]MCM2577211.1 Tm-1-like ATP-binding domain-containing protein [Streptomyces meridianus]
MAIVALVGTMDTKGVEYGWLRDRLHAAGVRTVLIDAGTYGEPRVRPDIERGEVARAAGADVEVLRADGDRGAAVTVMARGAAEIARRLHAADGLHGLLALGGSGGTSIATRAMRELPLGVPKLMVSSMVSGDVAPYVGASDIAMMFSIVDIAGVNRVSAPILANAADAMAGMARGYAASRAERSVDLASDGRPLVAATMAGVTTPGVDAARERLVELGYEVLVFHAVGSGGRSMEALADQGLLAGVLDLTLCEIADDLLDGKLSAGPDRLRAAGRRGIPQVTAPGALDMVKYGPLDSLPDHVRDRRVLVHNPSITVIRTSADECARLGRHVAAKLREAKGATALRLPLRGLSTLGAPGGPYHDADADEALFTALREGLSGSPVEVTSMDTDLNDPEFGRAAAERLHAMIGETEGAPGAF